MPNRNSPNQSGSGVKNRGVDKIEQELDKGKKSLDNLPVKINMADRVPAVPTKSTSLRYPDDIKDQKTDYVLFEFGNYVPPFSGGQGANINND